MNFWLFSRREIDDIIDEIILSTKENFGKRSIKKDKGVYPKKYLNLIDIHKNKNNYKLKLFLHRLSFLKVYIYYF